VAHFSSQQEPLICSPLVSAERKLKSQRSKMMTKCQLTVCRPKTVCHTSRLLNSTIPGTSGSCLQS
jgi:hypothetical protein